MAGARRERENAVTRTQPRPKTIAAVVSDVDGTLVRSDKSLTPRTIETVRNLRTAGIKFAIVSSRPPRGLKTVIERLAITAPVAGFNGGVIVSPELSVIARHLIAPDVARRAVDLIEASGANAWIFSGDQWLVRDRNGARVALEERTVEFPPTAIDEFTNVIGTAAKIVAVSDDFTLLTKLQDQVRNSLGRDANVVRSQKYYLDITHPLANKGNALLELARLMAVSPADTAVVGDGENDMDMFIQAGLSIAMGNASAEVRAAADFVTGGNNGDGAAAAIDWFVLRGERTAIGRAVTSRDVA
jgi:Cof subfamily protein (haloacid dehalogenase superfamily)